MYVAVRGRLEVHPFQRAEVERITARGRDPYAGFFLLSDERRQSTTWTVRGGQVLEAPAPAELRWFAELP